MLISTVAHAQESGQAASPPAFTQFMPFIFIFIIFYLLLIRPQQKRQKKHQGYLTQLKRGDSVLTSGGVLGTIEGLTEKFITLEVSDGVRIRILRANILGPANEETK